jgi:hypothetical protein
LRIEWRSRAEGEDALLAVEDEDNKVLGTWEANPPLLKDFLNDMEELQGKAPPNEVSSPNRYPEEWGALVIARSEDGDVLLVDPQLYWEGVAYWFRAHGDDPHRWGRRE